MFAEKVLEMFYDLALGRRSLSTVVKTLSAERGENTTVVPLVTGEFEFLDTHDQEIAAICSWWAKALEASVNEAQRVLLCYALLRLGFALGSYPSATDATTSQSVQSLVDSISPPEDGTDAN